MNTIRKWIFPVSILAGCISATAVVITLRESLIAANNESWMSKYRFHIMDIGYLTDQYTHHRMETGVWPESDQLYGTFFQLQKSTRSPNGREDTFSDLSFGPIWLQFTLSDDGHISTHLLKEAPVGILKR